MAIHSAEPWQQRLGVKTLAHPDKTAPFRIWQKIAKRESIEVELIAAVAYCETGTNGGFLPSGNRTVLFDKYEFSKQSGHVFDQSNPELSTPTRERDIYRLMRSQQRANEDEYKIVLKAMDLDQTAALNSLLWGMFLIPSRFCMYILDDNEEDHIECFIETTRGIGALHYLRDRKWAEFGKRYNPVAMSQDSYDARLRDAYRRFKADRKAMLASCAHVDIKALQKE